MPKLDKGSFPDNSQADDFAVFGPPAIEDGQFDKCKIADLGCFDQSGKDSNKYYHAAIVQHRTNKKWYVYFEWGRTGATSPQFQFAECTSEAEAQREFAKQLHDKNDKRGQWVTVAGVRTLQAKAGKDCYLVRPMATRSTGLPDAKTIKLNENIKVTSKTSRKVDSYTLKLMQDLNVATVSYARGSMADASLPTQRSIDEARQILQEAQKRLVKVGDNVDNQVKDKDLIQLTNVIYSRIPKKKALHCDAKDWILNKDNIFMWAQDLDCFSSALQTVECADVDPLGGIPADIEWIDPISTLGKFLYKWWPNASANKHYGVGQMKIKNMWKVSRHGEDNDVLKGVERIKKDLKNSPIKERPPFQPTERYDCTERIKDYKETNTNLLFHGSRTQNISGILRTGFREPKELVGVVITGNMYSASGSGLYIADDWRKSAGYCSTSNSYWAKGSGTVGNRDAFMFACDVVLGNPHIASGSYPYVDAPKGTHSIFGKAGLSGVQNNEYVVFKKDQRAIKYLLEFTI